MKRWIRNWLICIAILIPGWFVAQTNPPAAQQPVQAIAAPRNPLPPEAASAGVTKFSYIVYGDTRGRRDGVEVQYEHRMVVEGMLAAIKRYEATEYPVKFVLQSGDAAVDGRDAQQWNTSFIPLINRITTEAGVPYYLAPGNHDLTGTEDLASPQRLQGLRNYLRALTNLIPPDTASRRLAEYPTFAFGYGNTFVVAIDSNIANDPIQFEWVKSQFEGLDRNRYLNVVVFFHHPVYSSGPHGGARIEAPTLALRNRYMPLFRTHHVKAIFAGHDHLFEHWIERYTDSTGVHRIDQVVTGGGGAPLYGYMGEPDLTSYLRASEALKVQVEHLVKPGLDPGDNPYHFVVVRVDGEQIDLEVICVDFGTRWQPYRSNKVTLRDPE